MELTSSPQREWERVAIALREYRDTERRAWGNVDDGLLGRFLAGECSEPEAARVHQAVQDCPKLRDALRLVRQVLFETRTAPQVAVRWREHPEELLAQVCQRVIRHVFSGDAAEVETFQVAGQAWLAELVRGGRPRPALAAAFGLGEADTDAAAKIRWIAVAEEAHACLCDCCDELPRRGTRGLDSLEENLRRRLESRGLPPALARAAAVECRAYVESLT